MSLDHEQPGREVREEVDEAGRAALMKAQNPHRWWRKVQTSFPTVCIVRDSGRLNALEGSGLFKYLYKHNH